MSNNKICIKCGLTLYCNEQESDTCLTCLAQSTPHCNFGETYSTIEGVIRQTIKQPIEKPKPMTILKLKQAIEELENSHGNINDVTINFRSNPDSDIEICNFVEEDLYKEDNKTLDSIVFLTEE